jgi:hypothetical protein
MKQAEKELLFQELREVCSGVGYLLRMEKGDFRGGHCILKQEKILVVNKRLSLDARLVSLARALGEMGIDDVYVKPAVREFIESETSKNAAASTQEEAAV